MPATDILTETQADHLLRRAAFGPLKGETEALSKKSRLQAVEVLLPAKGRKSKGPAPKSNSRDNLEKLQRWWLKQMRSKRWRAAEKMVLFWHDHIPSSYDVVGNVRWMALQNQLMRRNALGNYRTMIYEITLDPAMLDYLDGFRNDADSPNENFGRELMELFCLGPSDLAGNPNYTQNDVVDVARACTGMGSVYKGKKNNKRTDKVMLYANDFDAGNKTLFEGRSFETTGNLGVLDADGDPFPASRNVIDLMFAHTDTDGRPTLARFLAKKLWEWFAYPDPAIELIDELADVFVSSGYEIRPLMVALFTHDEFYSAVAMESTAKTPVDFVLQSIQAFGARGKFDELPDNLRSMGMEIFNPPSVDGWNNTIAWLSTSRLLARFRFAQDLASGRDKKGYKLDPKKLLPKSAASTEDVVDPLLAATGLTIPATSRQVLIDYLDGGTHLGDDDWLEIKYRGLLVLLMTMPEFQVH